MTDGMYRGTDEYVFSFSLLTDSVFDLIIRAVFIHLYHLLRVSIGDTQTVLIAVVLEASLYVCGDKGLGPNP